MKMQKATSEQFVPFYTPIAKCLFHVFDTCKIKVHPLIFTFFSLLIPYMYLNWVDETGFNQQTGQIFMVLFLYKLLKEFYKCSFQNIQYQERFKITQYLQKLLEPLGLFYLYSVLFEFSLLYELEIQFHAIFYCTVAPFVIKKIQNRNSHEQNFVFGTIKKLKGKYFILTQVYLLIFTVNPILKHVYVMNIKLPYFIIMTSTIIGAFLVIIYIVSQLSRNFDSQIFWTDDKNQFSIYKIAFLIITILPPVFHMYLSYTLDTLLATRFIYQIWICLHFGYFLANLKQRKQKQTEFKIQQKKTIHFSFTYGFTVYFIEMICFYFFPIQNMVVRIIITYINIALIFIPSLGLLLRQIYEDFQIMRKK